LPREQTVEQVLGAASIPPSRDATCFGLVVLYDPEPLQLVPRTR
jgi:hypothetical protein